MPTTTNFGWTTPADTDLVKNGAAAIRTLAGNIDTGLVDLKGGTTGQYLAKNSNTDLDYVWSTLPAAGGMTLITETVANANASIDFSSISGSYKQLLFIWRGIVHSTTGSEFNVRFNNDSTSKYSVQAGYHKLDAVVTKYISTDTSIMGGDAQGRLFGINSTNTDATQASVGYLLIDNYASTSKHKTFTGAWSYQKVTEGHTSCWQMIGTYLSTSAITAINIVRLTGSATLSNISDTSIRLYGIS